MEQQESRWGLAERSAGVGVWDLDVQTESVCYSSHWKARLGYDGADGYESTAVWRSRVHPDDLKPMLDTLTRHLAGQDAGYESDFRLRAADGSYRRVLSRGRVVERDEHGAPLRAVGTLIDLSDRFDAGSWRGEEGSAAVRKIGNALLSRMSHELRTPLNAVLGFAQLMALRAGSCERDEQLRYAQQIEHAGWRLLQMIDDVLDLKSVEGGRMDLQIGFIALAPIVDAVIDAHAAQARDAGVAVHGIVQSDGAGGADAGVLADGGRLQQAIGNLVANAVKSSRRGGSVTVGSGRHGDMAIVSVTDTGRGIAADRIAHLFEPFSRAGHGVPGVDGIGVGLVLTKALIETMGGRLRVASREGEGTRFEVSFPAAESPRP